MISVNPTAWPIGHVSPFYMKNEQCEVHRASVSFLCHSVHTAFCHWILDTPLNHVLIPRSIYPYRYLADMNLFFRVLSP